METPEWQDNGSGLPAENVVVMTKIDDEKGTRNEQPLKLNRGLWYYPDTSMYVYYRPTHWRFLNDEEQEAVRTQVNKPKPPIELRFR